MLGAFEVAQTGDLANWKIPGRFSPGAGGGIELAQKARRVVVLTSHTDRAGNPKLKAACSLPVTARGCVARVLHGHGCDRTWVPAASPCANWPRASASRR